MAVNPVETNPRTRTDQLKTTPGKTEASANRALFAETLRALSADGKQEGPARIPAAAAAEMLRLEMLKSAVYPADATPEMVSPPAGQTVMTLLTSLSAPEQHPAKCSYAAPGSALAGEGSESSLDTMIVKAARRYGVAEGLIRAVIKAESNFNQRAVSRAGAQGLMQLMPATARGLGVTDPFDPEQNIMAGTRFLRDMLDRYDGDLDSALAAYNWGPGNVDKGGGLFPKETREYLLKVKNYYTRFIG